MLRASALSSPVVGVGVCFFGRLLPDYIYYAYYAVLVPCQRGEGMFGTVGLDSMQETIMFSSPVSGVSVCL